MYKLYAIDFEGVWPVGNALIIKADSVDAALKLAQDTVTHTTVEREDVKEIEIKDGPQVIEYLSGDY